MLLEPLELPLEPLEKTVGLRVGNSVGSIVGSNVGKNDREVVGIIRLGLIVGLVVLHGWWGRHDVKCVRYEVL